MAEPTTTVHKDADKPVPTQERLVYITDKQHGQLANIQLQVQALQLQFESAVGAILAGEDIPEGTQFQGIIEAKKLFGGKKFALKLAVPKK